MTIPRLRRSGSRLLFHARYTDGVIDALTGQAATFARAGDAYALGSNGIYSRAPHSRARFEVGSGVPGLLLEGSQENLLLQSSNLDDTASPWAGNGNFAISEAVSAIPGQTAYRHENDGGGVRDRRQAAPTFAEQQFTFAALVEPVDVANTSVGLFRDSNGQTVLRVDYSWSTGNVSVVEGSIGSSSSGGVVDVTGLKLIWGTVQVDASVTGAGGRCAVSPTGITTNTDTAIVHHVQLVEAGYLTAPIVTGGSAVTRATEALYYAWSVGATKPWSAYAKFVAPPAGSPALLRISGSAPDVLLDISSGEIRVVHDNNSSTVSSTTSGVSMSQGDVVEARVRFGSDGKVTAAASVNEGTEVVGTQSSALSIASWGSARIYPGGLAAEQNRVGIREIKVHPDPDLTLAQLRSA